jgi:ABC-type phosphate transport system substrate-binding protein
MKSKKNKIISLASAFALVLVTLTGCGRGGASGGGDTVVISGSTSVQPFIEVLAEYYEKTHGGSPVDVQGGGSSAGIIAAQRGMADIGMSSRGLRGDELESRHVTIARDGLALVVNQDNPVSDLTLEQIRAIYTREITNWSQIYPNWLEITGARNDDIHVVTREEGSGTRGAFTEMVMDWRTRAVVSANLAPDWDCEDCVICETVFCTVCERCQCEDCEGNVCKKCEQDCEERHAGCASCVACEVHRGSVRVFRDTNHSETIHARTIVLNTNGAIRQFVAGNVNAIGYISLGTVVLCGLTPVKQLAIDGVAPFVPSETQTSCSNCTGRCTSNGNPRCTPYTFNPSYGLSRPFVFIIGAGATPETEIFVGFILSNEGQAKLAEYGLITGSEHTHATDLPFDGSPFRGGAAL